VRRADRQTDPPRTPRSMSAVVLAVVVFAALTALKLVDLVGGGRYVCPACGAKRQDRHASDCPWHG